MQHRVAKTALQIIYLYSNQVDNDPWVNRESKQAYSDCLTSMRVNGLIVDFDLLNKKVKIGENWFTFNKGAVVETE